MIMKEQLLNKVENVCHHVFKSQSAAEASESDCMLERVKAKL